MIALGAMAASALDMNITISGAATKLVWVSGCSAALATMRPQIGRRVPGMIADVLIATCLFAVISTAAGLWSYVAATVSHGYHDDLFVALDRALRFDWRQLYTLERSMPDLVPLWRGIYASFWNTPMIVIAALVLTGRQERLATFLSARLIGLAFTIALFVIVPLRSPLVEFLGTKPPYMPFIGASHVQIIDGLRDGSMNVIDLGALKGLIGFPSYHAAASILFIWACWPVKLLRWPMLLLNMGVIATTPVEGAHYLVDVLGGIVVAPVAIAVASRWRPRVGFEQRPQAQFAPAPN